MCEVFTVSVCGGGGVFTVSVCVYCVCVCVYCECVWCLL